MLVRKQTAQVPKQV